MCGNNFFVVVDMLMVRVLKGVRRALSDLGAVLCGVWELSCGALVALLTGFRAPKRADDVSRDALIICPSPLLNQQRFNETNRRKYVISFVNSACLSPQFFALKPDRYFLTDPDFFLSRIKAVAGLAAVSNEADRLIDTIANSTSWPMTVIVPWHYRNTPVARRMGANPNITVLGIPVANARSHNRAIAQFGFRRGFLNPVYQNVLVAAIFFNLKAEHRRVIVWGAHHNWLKDVEVDDANRIIHVVRHTDDGGRRELLLNVDGSPRRYHVYLKQLATMFEQYHVLREFADRSKQEIVNAMEDSFIDAFDRTTEIDLFAKDASTGSNSI